MNVLQNSFLSNYTNVQSVRGKVLDRHTDNNNVVQNNHITSFDSILKSKALENEDNNLKFSKHASNRLEQRNIELSDSQLERLNQGAKKASGKGINESLIMIDQLAFIVNIPNQTVITAMDQTETEENIFTNIDGAVIM